jgi:spore coat protein U-like protein
MRIARRLARHPLALAVWLALVLFVALRARPADSQTCFVNGAFGLNFGAVTSSGRAAASSLSFTCQPDFTTGHPLYYQACIYMNPGDWSVGQPTRRMTNYNNAFINYDLFSDPAHTLKIGPPGSTPVYQVQAATTGFNPVTTNSPIYGLVYPGQAVPAVGYFQEEGIHGLVRYRFSSAGFPASADCTAGGTGGGSVTFDSSGVVATFENACWVAATDMDFGSVPPPQAPLREHGSIRVQCAPGTAWRVGLDNGQNFDGVMRRMAGPRGYVLYQLYRDESNTQVWGNDSASMVPGTTDAAGNTASLTVYGQVPAQPNAAAGGYIDTVIATLYY